MYLPFASDARILAEDTPPFSLSKNLTKGILLAQALAYLAAAVPGAVVDKDDLKLRLPYRLLRKALGAALKMLGAVIYRDDYGYLVLKI